MRWPNNCRFCDSPKPQSFAALMDMYEHNYMRLRCLCPQLALLRQRYVSQVDGAHDLQLTILEQSPHTTRFELTYLMDEGTRPDVVVRVCHDSRQAEVESRACRLSDDRVSVAANLEASLRCRWQMNRFLYKWLNYVHRQGHNFEHPELKRVAESDWSKAV